MKQSSIWRRFLLASCLVATGMARAGDAPFLQSLTLADGGRVVVAEAPLEPRSIGSFSIRLYSGANPAYPYDDFLTGLVAARDGFLERVLLADLDGDRAPELVVLLRSAGSGSYLVAQAYKLEPGGIKLFARVDNIQPGEDPLEQLRQ